MNKSEQETLKLNNKNNIYTLIFYILILIIIMFFIVTTTLVFQKNQMYSEEDIACYTYHVQECLDAHSKNLTFALCSGFYFEPREEDKTIFCAIHPKEDCWSNVPKECLLR